MAHDPQEPSKEDGPEPAAAVDGPSAAAPDAASADPDPSTGERPGAPFEDAWFEPSPFDAGPDDEVAPLEEVVVYRPVEAAAPVRGPLALGGTAIAGVLMGTADVMPGFSGGTVALVVGIYERLIANIRQGARCLSLLVRGRPQDALRAFLAIEWLFVGALLAGILVAIFTLAGILRTLIEEQPVLLKATFFGLVLGAAVVASRELRSPSPWHVLVGILAAIGTFVGLGAVDGGLLTPSPLTLFLGGAIAISAMILPGISGSFILLVLGLYEGVINAAADRSIGLLLLFGLGCVAGLAALSTLLNWLLARFHDIVLAALIGLMVGSARVLWPYPSDADFVSVELGAPEGTASLLALAFALTAFSVIWILSLVAAAIQRRRARRAPVTVEGTGVDNPTVDPPPADPS